MIEASGSLPSPTSKPAELVHSLRCAPLLTGYRGAEPVDVDAVADLLVRLSLLTSDVPEIRELDLNPVIASSDRVVAVDARVRVAPVAADRFAVGQCPTAVTSTAGMSTVELDRNGLEVLERDECIALLAAPLSAASPSPPTRSRSCCP